MYNNKTEILKEIRSNIDSKKSNLSYFNMIFFLTAFPDIYHVSQNGLNKLFYNNKMPTYAELIEILKPNEIIGYSHFTKSKLIDLLVKRGLIPEKYDVDKQGKAMKDIDPKYNFLWQICKNPKKVEMHDLEQIRLFFILLCTRLPWHWIQIPNYLECIMKSMEEQVSDQVLTESL